MPEMTNIADRPRQRTDPAFDLAARYDRVRRFSESIARPLSPEDCAIQSMPDVSPTRWHLAHTTWFFETFLLKNQPGYQVFDDRFESLFNSYYNTVGRQFPRSKRGLISRPGFDETLAYRHHVDQSIGRWIRDSHLTDRDVEVLTIGINHEQQHQELMLTDIKHVLSCNPLEPVYTKGESVGGETAARPFVGLHRGRPGCHRKRRGRFCVRQ